MRRDELEEFHYITRISNMPSILQRGILSHNKAANVQHESVADPTIQARRKKVTIPGARPLHDYVNLYFCARNPMMFVKRSEHKSLCVLRVTPAILDLPGVVIADRNASSDHVRFGPAPAALGLVDRDGVFAESWKHPEDVFEEWRHKSVKCAEVLVPDWVEPSHILGAYVSGVEARDRFQLAASGLLTTIDPNLFFQS